MSQRYFNSSKVRLELDASIVIGISLFYFNSSKVRLEPCGHKCGLCLCITWLLWQRYDKNREKNVDVGKLISDVAMTTVFQRGTMLSKNSNFNFHEQY